MGERTCGRQCGRRGAPPPLFNGANGISGKTWCIISPKGSRRTGGRDSNGRIASRPTSKLGRPLGAYSETWKHGTNQRLEVSRRVRGDTDAASVRGISNSRGVIQDDQLSGIYQCGGRGPVRQSRSLGELLTAASLVGGGFVGYRAAAAAGQGPSPFAQAARGPATGLEDQAGSLDEGCLTSTREPWRISTNIGLHSSFHETHHFTCQPFFNLLD